MKTKDDLVRSLRAELETQNFENLIDFYRDELKAIQRGSLSIDVLRPTQRRKLRRSGILERRTVFPNLTVSKEAQDILRRMERRL